MKKRVVALFAFGVLSVFLVAFVLALTLDSVSAFSFGDLWGKVTGKVTEGETASVNVLVQEYSTESFIGAAAVKLSNGAGTYTGVWGGRFYSFSLIPSGTYTLTASANGYQTYSEANVIVNPGVNNGRSLYLTKTTVSGTCSDSDKDAAHPDGKNYETKGKVTVGTQTYEDTCRTYTELYENYCDSAGKQQYVSYTCSQCSDGKCVTSGGGSISATCKDSDKGNNDYGTRGTIRGERIFTETARGSDVVIHSATRATLTYDLPGQPVEKIELTLGGRFKVGNVEGILSAINVDDQSVSVLYDAVTDVCLGSFGSNNTLTEYGCLESGEGTNHDYVCANGEVCKEGACVDSFSKVQACIQNSIEVVSCKTSPSSNLEKGRYPVNISLMRLTADGKSTLTALKVNLINSSSSDGLPNVIFAGIGKASILLADRVAYADVSAESTLDRTAAINSPVQANVIATYKLSDGSSVLCNSLPVSCSVPVSKASGGNTGGVDPALEQFVIQKDIGAFKFLESADITSSEDAEDIAETFGISQRPKFSASARYEVKNDQFESRLVVHIHDVGQLSAKDFHKGIYKIKQEDDGVVYDYDWAGSEDLEKVKGGQVVFIGNEKEKNEIIIVWKSDTKVIIMEAKNPNAINERQFDNFISEYLRKHKTDLVVTQEIIDEVEGGKSGNKICNEGCTLENKCVPFGTRSKGLYCSLQGSMSSQKGDGGACDNSWECFSNECNNDICVNTNVAVAKQAGIIKKLWCRVLNPISEEGYNKCLKSGTEGP